LFVICFILMETINPAVERLESKKIPRPLAIGLIYLLLLTFIGFAVAGIIPSFVSQFNGIVNFLPESIEQLDVFGMDASNISSQFRLFEKLPENIAKTTISIFSNIFSGIVILMITFYMLLERKKMNEHSFNLLGKKRGATVLKVIGKIEHKLASWSKAELMLMIIVGVLSYTGYMILGLDFALALGLIAAILELIPNVGPIVTTVLASLVALNQSPLIVGLTIIWGILVQQLENNFIVPKIMKTKVGLNPLVTVFSLAVGAKLGGIIGTILAIPCFLILETIARVVIFDKNRGK
jgi:predicted PurR-regulated permease PerM